MVYMLAAALGMRIGEALGLEIDKHFADDFSTVLVRQKVRKCKTEDYLKTDNAYRDIDLHSSVVKTLGDPEVNRLFPNSPDPGTIPSWPPIGCKRSHFYVMPT